MWRPANRIEYSDRIEVVPPVRDQAIADRKHGDIPVGVPTPSSHNAALGGVLEHHDALGRIVVNGQIKATVKNDHGAVGAVQLSDCGTALDMPRVPRNRHHIVDGDVLGEEVENGRLDQPIQACSMIRKTIGAAKSARLATDAFTMPRLLPRRSGLEAKVGEADGAAPARENVAVGLGAAIVERAR